MTTLYDVPANKLIELTATKLKSDERFIPPEWASWVKTGMHREHPPQNDDWWYVRCAALLRRIAMDGPLARSDSARSTEAKPTTRQNLSDLSREWLNNSKSDATTRERGFVKTTPKGREISSQGRSLLDKSAYELAQNA